LRALAFPRRRLSGLPVSLIALAVALACGTVACGKNTAPPENTQPVTAKTVLPDAPAGGEFADRAGQNANFNFAVKDMHGATVQLASFKGRPLVVNFWATWCPPCKLEIPWFIEFKKQYAGDGLEILGVSIDDPAPELIAFSSEHKMNYPVLLGLDQEKLLAAYDAEVSVPVTWFIKKDGTVQARTIGINSKQYFETQIKALF